MGLGLNWAKPRQESSITSDYGEDHHTPPVWAEFNAEGWQSKVLPTSPPCLSRLLYGREKFAPSPAASRVVELMCTQGNPSHSPMLANTIHLQPFAPQRRFPENIL